MGEELEALRTIGNIRVKEKYSDEPSKVSDLKTLFKNQYNIIEKSLKRLKPMKVKKHDFGTHIINQCSNPDCTAYDMKGNYCYNCGHPLEWGEKNENT